LINKIEIIFQNKTPPANTSPKHPSLLHTKRPPDTHSSTRHRKEPASPHTTSADGAEQDGAPKWSEARGGGGRAWRWRGAGIISIITAEFAEVRRDG